MRAAAAGGRPALLEPATLTPHAAAGKLSIYRSEIGDLIGYGTLVLSPILAPALHAWARKSKSLFRGPSVSGGLDKSTVYSQS
jgi:hypothetical protein